MICSGSFATLTIRPLGNLRQVLSDHGRGNDSKRFLAARQYEKTPRRPERYRCTVKLYRDRDSFCCQRSSNCLIDPGAKPA